MDEELKKYHRLLKLSFDAPTLKGKKEAARLLDKQRRILSEKNISTVFRKAITEEKRI